MAIPILGKIIDTVIGKGADLISEFITDKDKAAEFTHKFKMAVLEDKASERELEAEMYKADRKRRRVEARVALRLRKKLLQSYNTKRTKNKQQK